MAEAAYLRLVAGNDQSGESDPQQCISKEGDELLRRLIVGCAHYLSTLPSISFPHERLYSRTGGWCFVAPKRSGLPHHSKVGDRTAENTPLAKFAKWRICGLTPVQ